MITEDVGQGDFNHQHEDTLYYQPVLWITGTGLASNDNSVLCEIVSHLMSGECRSTRGLRRVAGMSVTVWHNTRHCHHTAGCPLYTGHSTHCLSCPLLGSHTTDNFKSVSLLGTSDITTESETQKILRFDQRSDSF